MNRCTSFQMMKDLEAKDKLKMQNPDDPNVKSNLGFCVLQKVSNSPLEVRLSHNFDKKTSFNLCLLNDFKNTSELQITQGSYPEFSEFPKKLPYLINLFLENSRINHLNVQALLFEEWDLTLPPIDARKMRNLLNWGFRKKQIKKLSFQEQYADNVDPYLFLFNKILRTYKLSSIGWQNDIFWPHYRKGPKASSEFIERRPGFQVAPINFQKFARNILHLSEFCLEGNIALKHEPSFLNILHPFSSLTNRSIQLPSFLPLHTLTLNPLNMTSAGLFYLFDILKLASQLKVLTIGIRESHTKKFDIKEISIPANVNVEDFTLVLWDFKSEAELTSSLKLLLGSIEIMLPSLRKFSLESRWQERDYKHIKKPSTLKLGSFLKNLGKLKNLRTLNIETDTCKGITIDSLGECASLERIRIVTTPLLETAKLKDIPENVHDLTFEYPTGHVDFGAGHQKLLADYFNNLKTDKAASNNLQILTFSGYEIYPKIAGLITFLSLTTLNLIKCRITQAELALILNCESLVSLKELNLSETNVRDNSLRNHEIFNLLEQTKAVEQLEVLGLSSFRCGRGFQLPATPQKFKNLRKLDMSSNYLQREEVNGLITVKFPKLEELHLESRWIRPHQVIGALAEKIALIDHIKTIYLSWPHLSDLGSEVQPDLDSSLKRFNEKSLGHIKIRVNFVSENHCDDDNVLSVVKNRAFAYLKNIKD